MARASWRLFPLGLATCEIERVLAQRRRDVILAARRPSRNAYGSLMRASTHTHGLHVKHSAATPSRSDTPHPQPQHSHEQASRAPAEWLCRLGRLRNPEAQEVWLGVRLCRPMSALPSADEQPQPQYPRTPPQQHRLDSAVGHIDTGQGPTQGRTKPQPVMPATRARHDRMRARAKPGRERCVLCARQAPCTMCTLPRLHAASRL